MSRIQVENYFDVSAHLITKGMWAEMTYKEIKLYTVLCYLANKFSRNGIFQSDKQLRVLTGIRSKETLLRAKKALKKRGLIDYSKKEGLRTDYVVFSIITFINRQDGSEKLEFMPHKDMAYGLSEAYYKTDPTLKKERG